MTPPPPIFQSTPKKGSGTHAGVLYDKPSARGENEPPSVIQKSDFAGVERDGEEIRRTFGKPSEGSPKEDHPRVRVHNSRWSVRVQRPPVLVVWDAVWKPNPEARVQHAKKKLRGGASLWMTSAPGEPAVLTLYPADTWAHDAKGIGEAEALRAGIAREQISKFCAANAAAWDTSSFEQVAPSEYAVELDGLQPFGRVGEDLVWVDGSPGVGRFEVETRDARVACALLEWAANPHARALDVVVAEVQR